MLDHLGNTVFSLVAVFISGGLGTVAFSATVEYFRQRRRELQSVRYLAVRIAHTLEQYALEAAELVSKDELFRDAHGHAGKRISGLPEFPPLPIDEAYKHLDPDLFDEILSLTHKERLADRNAEFWFDVDGDQQNVRGSYCYDALGAAVQAFTTARKLRIEYGFQVSKAISKSESFWREKHDNWAEARRAAEESSCVQISNDRLSPLMDLRDSFREVNL